MDDSGRITYTELLAMVREELKIKEKTLAETSLQSLWRALDEDSSGFVSVGAFGHFMKKGLGATAHEAEKTHAHHPPTHHHASERHSAG